MEVDNLHLADAEALLSFGFAFRKKILLMITKNKKDWAVVVFCTLLVTISFGCNSNSDNYGKKIKESFDNYDRIVEDYESYMRQMAKDKPGRISSQSYFDSAKNACLRLNKIDISETPPEFQDTFKKRISLTCDNLNSPADQVTYENDPKNKTYKNVERELKEVSLKYGYIYQKSESPK